MFLQCVAEKSFYYDIFRQNHAMITDCMLIENHQQSTD